MGERPPPAGLNPLHCGAVVASRYDRNTYFQPLKVLIPFIAGQWSLHLFLPVGVLLPLVLIPFIAGQWSLHRDDGWIAIQLDGS